MEDTRFGLVTSVYNSKVLTSEPDKIDEWVKFCSSGYLGLYCIVNCNNIYHALENKSNLYFSESNFSFVLAINYSTRSELIYKTRQNWHNLAEMFINFCVPVEFVLLLQTKDFFAYKLFFLFS